MVQSIPRLDVGGRIGAAAGQGIGQGIASGAELSLNRNIQNEQLQLQNQYQLQQIQAREAAKQQQKLALLQSVFGISPGQISQSPQDQIQGIGENRSNEYSMQQPAQQSAIQNLSDDQIAAATLVDPNLGRVLQEQKKLKRREFESERKFHTDRSSKFLDEIRQETKGINEREIAVDSAISAVNSGQMSPLGGDFWAGILNLPSLRTESGAALQAAAKVNLIGSLGRVGARPNQFIEKQISDAFAQAGETKSAQMAKLQITKAVLDLDKKRGQIANKLADEYRQELRYVPENIDSLVEKQMQPFAEMRMEKLSYDLQRSREKSQSPEFYQTLQKVFPGTPLTPEKYQVFYNKAQGKNEEERDAAAIRMAKKAGYKILDESVLLGQ